MSSPETTSPQGHRESRQPQDEPGYMGTPPPRGMAEGQGVQPQTCSGNRESLPSQDTPESRNIVPPQQAAPERQILRQPHSEAECRYTRQSHEITECQDALPSQDAPESRDAAQPQKAAAGTATRRELLDRLTGRLTGLYDAREARSIALIALAEPAGLPVSALLTDPGAPMAAEGFEALAEELAAGRPVQYVVGHTEFYGHRFAVREGVLIPRPETEELVAWIAHDERDAGALLDVGTGSGCIAASLALALPGTEVFAADLSDTALEVAAENCRALGARVTLRKADALGNLAEVFPEPLDAIVSNPPYVPQSDLAAMHANVRKYEPREALFVPDDDALRFYRAIARAGRQMLRPGGRLYFEIYERSAEEMRRMLGEEGYTGTEVREDLNGKPRMVCSRMK